MSSTDFHRLYREAYEVHVPELRRLFDRAVESDPEYMAGWMEHREYRIGNDPIELAGSSTEDVAHMREIFGWPLPASYQAYLEVMGEKGGRSNPDYAMMYRWAKQFNDRLVPELLEQIRESGRTDSKEFEVPSDAVFVGSHQGYIYLFLRDDGQEDPGIWLLHESPRIEQVLREDGSPFRFSDVVMSGIEHSIPSSRFAWRVKD